MGKYASVCFLFISDWAHTSRYVCSSLFATSVASLEHEAAVVPEKQDSHSAGADRGGRPRAVVCKPPPSPFPLFTRAGTVGLLTSGISQRRAAGPESKKPPIVWAG